MTCNRNCIGCIARLLVEEYARGIYRTGILFLAYARALSTTCRWFLLRLCCRLWRRRFRRRWRAAWVCAARWQYTATIDAMTWRCCSCLSANLFSSVSCSCQWHLRRRPPWSTDCDCPPTLTSYCSTRCTTAAAAAGVIETSAIILWKSLYSV